jgi:hypothetical protein
VIWVALKNQAQFFAIAALWKHTIVNHVGLCAFERQRSNPRRHQSVYLGEPR